MDIRIRFYLVLLLTIVILAISCDKIEENLVISDQQLTTDGKLHENYIEDSVIVETPHVLLEDFTGHLCVNCPEWALKAHEWVEETDHRLVVYSIHAGANANLNPEEGYVIDFTCQPGNELNSYFQVQFNPSALINRVQANVGQVVPPSFWEEIVFQQLEKENVANMKLINIYYPVINTLEVDVFTTILSDTLHQCKLAVILVEDHIIAPQRNNNGSIGPTPDWEDYEHRNVLRNAINGTFGGNISDSPTIVSDSTYFNKFYYSGFNENWVIDNCNVIAYIYEEESGEVLQVAELGIKTEE